MSTGWSKGWWATARGDCGTASSWMDTTPYSTNWWAENCLIVIQHLTKILWHIINRLHPFNSKEESWSFILGRDKSSSGGSKSLITWVWEFTGLVPWDSYCGTVWGYMLSGILGFCPKIRGSYGHFSLNPFWQSWYLLEQFDCWMYFRADSSGGPSICSGFGHCWNFHCQRCPPPRFRNACSLKACWRTRLCHCTIKGV